MEIISKFELIIKLNHKEAEELYSILYSEIEIKIMEKSKVLTKLYKALCEGL